MRTGVATKGLCLMMKSRYICCSHPVVPRVGSGRLAAFDHSAKVGAKLTQCWGRYST